MLIFVPVLSLCLCECSHLVLRPCLQPPHAFSGCPTVYICLPLLSDAASLGRLGIIMTALEMVKHLRMPTTRWLPIRFYTFACLLPTNFIYRLTLPSAFYLPLAIAPLLQLSFTVPLIAFLILGANNQFQFTRLLTNSI